MKKMKEIKVLKEIERERKKGMEYLEVVVVLRDLLLRPDRWKSRKD